MHQKTRHDAAGGGKTAVIYARYSSHNQRDVSIDQQVKAVREFAEREDLTIDGIYADRALTGTNDNRPEFQRMIEDSKKGTFAYVIVYSLDRFARDRYDSVVYKRILKDNGVRVLSAMESISDDPTGVLLESMLEGLAEYYSRELATKIRRGLNDNASKCMVIGTRSYGYRKGKDGKFEIDPVEAEVVREIYARVLTGEAFLDIARDLNRRGIKTRLGKPWVKSSFASVLSNPRYVGTYVYGDLRIEGGIPAILDRETFDRVQEYLKLKRNPQGAPGKRRRENGVYLLTGKVYCGHCKSAMIGKSGTSRNGNLYAYYACKKQVYEKNCGKQKIGRERLEYLVAKALKDYALQDGMIEWLADKSIAYRQKHAEPVEVTLLKDQLKQTESAIRNIMTAIEQGIITPTTKDRLTELEAEKADLTAKIALKKPDKLSNLSRDDIISALSLVRVGDLEDKNYQELLFSMFLRAVYLYDDHLKIIFNYTRDGHDTAEIPFDIEAVGAGDGDSVRLNSDELHAKTLGQVAEGFLSSVLRLSMYYAMINAEQVFRKGSGSMEKFIPKKKMSKKAQKKMAGERRSTWAFSPITRKIDSKKIYNRKRLSRTGSDDGRDFLLIGNSALSHLG